MVMLLVKFGCGARTLTRDYHEAFITYNRLLVAYIQAAVIILCKKPLMNL